MTAVHTITLFEADYDEIRNREGHPIDYQVVLDETAPEYVINEGQRVLNSVDEATCPVCDGAIGFYLNEYEDTRGNIRSGGGYSYYWVATDGENAWSLCEDCIPQAP